MSLESSASLWDGLSFWLLAIGAGLAFVGTVAGIRARQLGRILAKEREATTIREKAASDRAIAEANAKAAEANKIAEQERLARLRIEASLAPRNLNPDQQKAVGRALIPFGPQRVGVFILSKEAEAVRLSQQIESALIAGHWTVDGPWPTITGTVVGVVVMASSDADDSVKRAGKALAGSLESELLSAKFDPKPFDRKELPAALTGPPWSEENNAKLRLFVGEKPR